MPVYLSHHRPSNTTRLVRAPNRAQALRHVSETEFALDVATPDELITHVGAGVKVETAGEAIEDDVNNPLVGFHAGG